MDEIKILFKIISCDIYLKKIGDPTKRFWQKQQRWGYKFHRFIKYLVTILYFSNSGWVWIYAAIDYANILPADSVQYITSPTLYQIK